MGPRWCHLVREGSRQGLGLPTGPGQGWATACHTVGVKGGALSRGIRGTQPHEGGKGAPGLELWALQGLQARGGQVPGKGRQGLTRPAR